MRQMEAGVFDRQSTKAVKGIAILLMLMHHLWGFPDRIFLSGGFEHSLSVLVFGKLWYVYIGKFGKICVSIFLFLGGYGMMKSAESGKTDLIAKLKALYLGYWKVFLLFVPIAFLFFSKQPVYCAVESICTKYSAFSVQEFLKNLLGVSRSYNGEWWFLKSYIIAVLSFPVIRQMMSRHTAAVNVLGVIVWSILTTSVFPAAGAIETLGTLKNSTLYSLLFCQTAPFISCFWMGILMAKEDLLVKTADALRRNGLLSPGVDCFALLAVLFLRGSCYGAELDFLYVPALVVFASDLLLYLRCTRKLLIALGNQSTSMWYIHSFFCYYFYPVTRLVVFTGNAVLSLLTLTALSYAAAWGTEKIWEFPGNLCAKRKEATD